MKIIKKQGFQIGEWLANFHPEMLIFANLGVNFHVCLCSDLQLASEQMLYSFDIVQKSSF